VADADILRAAVVLLHASLEDFLRTLSRVRLPAASEDVLNSIPIAGSGSSRAEKFALGKLCAFRGKTVDDVIKQSVDEFLERSNYNTTIEIAGLLRNLGLKVETLNGRFAEIDEMMRRRHMIVHRADRSESKGRGKQIANSLSAVTVERWLDATREFAHATSLSIATGDVEAIVQRAAKQTPSNSVHN